MNTNIPYNDHIHLPNLKELKAITPIVSQSKFISGELSGFISINGDYIGEDDEIRGFSHPIPFAIYLDEMCESPFLDIVDFKYEAIPKYGIEVMIKTSILGLDEIEIIKDKPIFSTMEDEKDKEDILKDLDTVIEIEEVVESKSEKTENTDTSIEFIQNLNEELSNVISKSREFESISDDIFREKCGTLDEKQNENTEDKKIEIEQVKVVEDDQLLLPHNKTDDIDITVMDDEKINKNSSINFIAETTAGNIINVNEDSYVSYKVHKISVGESIEGIANDYGIKVDELKKVNEDINDFELNRKILVPTAE